MAPVRLACPIDGTPLQRAAGEALRCGQGHSFDRAREGYYNLLVVQHKASRDPGDDKAMVAARGRCLDAGSFAPLAARLVDLVERAADGMDERSIILDAGCGEGYYLDAVARSQAAAGRAPRPLAGIDISKWAVRAAAKRNSACFWAVATNRHLPFPPGSVGLLLSMFGFPVWESFAAVQPAGGLALVVDPGPDHLLELRSIIYPHVDRSGPPPLAAAHRAGYVAEDEQRLRFPIDLASSGQIADLLAMTPHAHRAPKAGREALGSRTHLTVTGDVVLRLLRRSAA